eukprot:1192228-Prorocentrum_minimum.AAC.2
MREEEYPTGWCHAAVLAQVWRLQLYPRGYAPLRGGLAAHRARTHLLRPDQHRRGVFQHRRYVYSSSQPTTCRREPDRGADRCTAQPRFSFGILSVRILSGRATLGRHMVHGGRGACDKPAMFLGALRVWWRRQLGSRRMPIDALVPCLLAARVRLAEA